MDEKERLSGVDVEIQNHAEQDHAQNVPAPDFLVLALFLAQSYGQMLKDRERLKAVIDAGVPIYTKEMAFRDLASASIMSLNGCRPAISAMFRCALRSCWITVMWRR